MRHAAGKRDLPVHAGQRNRQRGGRGQRDRADLNRPIHCLRALRGAFRLESWSNRVRPRIASTGNASTGVATAPESSLALCTGGGSGGRGLQLHQCGRGNWRRRRRGGQRLNTVGKLLDPAHRDFGRCRAQPDGYAERGLSSAGGEVGSAGRAILYLPVSHSGGRTGWFEGRQQAGRRWGRAGNDRKSNR